MKNTGVCPQCACEVWIPDALYEAAHASRGENGISFYCAYGHAQHYPLGETTLDKMRRDRDRLVQRIAGRDDEIKRQRELRKESDRRASAARGQATKIKNRVGHGVCPCCNRTFGNLARHMETQHSTFTAEAAE